MRDRPYRLPRPTPFRSLLVVVVLIVVALILVLLDRTGQLGPVRSQVELVLNPALAELSRAGQQIDGLRQGFTGQEPLRAQIRALEEENSRLRAENIRSQALIEENQRLRQQVRLEQERPWKLIGAGVLTYSPDAGRNVLRLGAGSQQGVRRGMAVIAQEGTSPPTLIGVVDQVTPQSASVLLITDFSSAISAQVFRGGRVASGVLQGQWQRGSRLRLEQVDRTTALAPGDIVVTAGLTAQLAPNLPTAEIPTNVPIGTVEAARVEGNSQQADVLPFVDPHQVPYAWVILSADG